MLHSKILSQKTRLRFILSLNFLEISVPLRSVCVCVCVCVPVHMLYLHTEAVRKVAVLLYMPFTYKAAASACVSGTCVYMHMCTHETRGQCMEDRTTSGDVPWVLSSKSLTALGLDK